MTKELSYTFRVGGVVMDYLLEGICGVILAVGPKVILPDPLVSPRVQTRQQLIPAHFVVFVGFNPQVVR